MVLDYTGESVNLAHSKLIPGTTKFLHEQSFAVFHESKLSPVCYLFNSMNKYFDLSKKEK